uniref:dynein light chain Tctex-type 5 n=1 Tax=Pristiophorus japonicus TaxID=55135 RepID=UPI00398EA90D
MYPATKICISPNNHLSQRFPRDSATVRPLVGGTIGSRGFGEVERLKTCRSFQGVGFPKIWSGQTSKGWGSAGAGNEVQRQQTRALAKREKKRREKERWGIQSQGSKAGASGSRFSSAPDIYQPHPARTFSAAQARAAIRSVLESRLKDAKYEPQRSAVEAVELAECVKKAVKALGYERYKIVCYLALGATRASDLSCSSRAVWSPNADTYAEFCFQNDSLFALCLVFAVYHE